MPPGYDGPLPDGYFIGRPTTTAVALLGRAFLVDGKPEPAVDVIKKTLKIYPYVPGSYGTSIAQLSRRQGCRSRRSSKPRTPKFVEGTGVP